MCLGLRSAAIAVAHSLCLLQISRGGVLKQLVLPILCELVYASARARELLWRVGGVSVYVDLLGESYWQVPALSAIHYWYVRSPFGTIMSKMLL